MRLARTHKDHSSQKKSQGSDSSKHMSATAQQSYVTEWHNQLDDFFVQLLRMCPQDTDIARGADAVDAMRKISTRAVICSKFWEHIKDYEEDIKTWNISAIQGYKLTDADALGLMFKFRDQYAGLKADDQDIIKRFVQRLFVLAKRANK